MNPRVSAEGYKLGHMVTRIADRGRELIAAKGLGDVSLPGMRSDMCPSCACRSGTVPNGCLQTQMDFLKAVSEGVPFLCHAPKDGRMCAGWVAARAAFVERPFPVSLQTLIGQWEFSPPDEPRSDAP